MEKSGEAREAREATVLSLVKDAKSGLHCLRGILEGSFSRGPEQPSEGGPTGQAPNILDDILSDLTEINVCIKGLNDFVHSKVLNKIS